eukprot:Hpha_TRINITY_DN16062_c0_g3::TRINITY_DN16062_c0_g3_i2::g.121845::m.121845
MDNECTDVWLTFGIAGLIVLLLLVVIIFREVQTKRRLRSVSEAAYLITTLKLEEAQDVLRTGSAEKNDVGNALIQISALIKEMQVYIPDPVWYSVFDVKEDSPPPASLLPTHEPDAAECVGETATPPGFLPTPNSPASASARGSRFAASSNSRRKSSAVPSPASGERKTRCASESVLKLSMSVEESKRDKSRLSVAEGLELALRVRRETTAGMRGMRIKRGSILGAYVDLRGLKSEGQCTTTLDLLSVTSGTCRDFDGSMIGISDSLISVCFGGIRPNSDHARTSCSCALALAPQWKERTPDLWWSISLCMGMLTVGEGGDSQGRIQICSGAPMRMTRSMSELSHHVNARLLMNEKLYQQVKTSYVGRVVDSIKEREIPSRQSYSGSPVSNLTSCKTTSSDVALPQFGDQCTLVYELLGEVGLVEDYSTYGEAFHSFCQLDFKRSREQFELHLTKVPRDTQALRLLRIVMYLQSPQYSASVSSVSTGMYTRAEIGWEDVEGMSLAVDLPETLRRESKESISSTGTTSFLTITMPSDAIGEGVTKQVSSRRVLRGTSEVVTLRQQIHAAQTQQTSEADNIRSRMQQFVSILAANMRTTQWRVCFDRLRVYSKVNRKARAIKRQEGETDLPAEFIDARYRRWYRGQKRLGVGAFGEVWMGMEDNGCLVALKCVKIQRPVDDPVSEPQSPLTPLTPAARRRELRKQRMNGGLSSPKFAPKMPLPPSLLEDVVQKHVEELLHEVQLMQRLQHDNIVEYLGSCVVAGHAFKHVIIIMEYMSGGSLMGVIEDFERVPNKSLQRYLRDVLNGLAYLHSEGVVHRDMKPHNVLLLIDGQCKLADFGASAQLTELNASNQGVIGTPLYMAPEACRGEVCKASDVWGLGIIICQIFSGEVPYKFTDTDPFNPQVFLYRLGKTADYCPQPPEALPFEARDLTEKCLQRDPDQRPTAEELQNEVFLLQ